MIKQPPSLFQRIFKHPISKILMGTLTVIFATLLVKELISKPILSLLFSAEPLIKSITAITGSFLMQAGEITSYEYIIGPKGPFQKVVFIRNPFIEIKGFEVSSSRAKNVLFTKIKS